MTKVARYIKNVRKQSISMGPTEERGAALWVGYEIEGVDDLSHLGLHKVDEEEAARKGVTVFREIDLETLMNDC
jgi:hypothetical protein